jgi:hypothetical protein
VRLSFYSLLALWIIKLGCLYLASLSRLVICLWAAPGGYQGGEYLKGFLFRRALALPKNTKISWNVLKEINIPA